MSEEKRIIQKDTKVNRFQLEIECEEASSVYQYWSDELADAEKERNLCDTQLKKLHGEKTLYYRKKPLNEDKVTEGSIRAMVESDEEYVKKSNELTQLQYLVNKLKGNVNALDKKTTHLTNLQKLSISGYYSNPIGNGQSSTDKASEQANSNLNK